MPECCPGWAQLDDGQEGCQKRMEINKWKGKFGAKFDTENGKEEMEWRGRMGN